MRGEPMRSGAGHGRWKVSRLTGAALTAMLVASGAAAQQVDADASPLAPSAAEGRACFQPRPMPVCRSFWVTEFGIQWFISEPPGVHDKRQWLATWEVGWMRNRTADDAVGGSVFLAANDNAFRSGVRARYRRWTGGRTAVDLSPALIVFQADENMEVRAQLGAALQGGVTYHDWIGLTTQVEAASGGVRFLAGVRLGGYPGAVVGTALPLYAFWKEGLHDES